MKSKAISILVILVMSTIATGVFAQGQEKVDICHVTNVPSEGDGVVISVADPAWDAHMEHGDKEVGDTGVTVDENDSKCHVLTGLGYISGYVTFADGFPIEQMEVFACEFEDNEPCWSAWTESDGSYLISSIPAGNDYCVYTGGSQGFSLQAYINASDCISGTRVPVTVGQVTEDINFSLVLDSN